MVKNLKLRTQLFTGNGVVLALMVLMSVVIYQSVNSLISTFAQVEHTHVVLEHAADIEAAAVNMETGMRGFLLAGQDEFFGYLCEWQ